MFIIVGLGNPGRRYEHTRHNAGFDVVDILAARHGIPCARTRCKATVGDGVIGGKKVMLAKPETYMNLSGESVVQLLSMYKPEAGELVVVYDDIDLPEGALRFREKGSAGTHNGMRNIVYLTGRDDIPRLRVGTGRPPEGWDVKDYVRAGYETKQARETMFAAFNAAADALERYVEAGANAARDAVARYNNSGREKEE